MTYKEARNSGKPFNRKKYDDDWYVVNRGNDCSQRDLSQRFWTEEDYAANDWIIKGEQDEKNKN